MRKKNIIGRAVLLFHEQKAHYRHRDSVLNRATVIVEHKESGRIVMRHSLAESCESCEEANAKIR